MVWFRFPPKEEFPSTFRALWRFERAQRLVPVKSGENRPERVCGRKTRATQVWEDFSEEMGLRPTPARLHPI